MSSPDSGAAPTGSIVAAYTAARRRPTELGSIQGYSIPWQFTVTQLAVGAVGAAVAGLLILVGVPWVLAVLPTAAVTLLCGRAVRRVRIDDRSLFAGVLGRLRSRATRRRVHPMSRQRTADVVAGNVMVGADHSMWMVLSVSPHSFGHLADPELRIEAVRAVEQLVASLSQRRWRIVSVMEETDPAEVAAQMAAAADTPSWQVEIDAETQRLNGLPLTRRSFFVMVDIGDARPPRGRGQWLARVRVATGFAPPARATWIDHDTAAAATAAAIAQAPRSMALRPATPSEVVRVLSRVPGAAPDVGGPEADFAHLMSTRPCPGAAEVGAGVVEGASAWRLGQAEWTEPRRGIAVARADTGSVAHMSAVVSLLPDRWLSPGGGELLWRLDALAESWDWVMDVTVVPPAVATAKARNLSRQLANQAAEYEREPSGPPPDLAIAADQIEDQRRRLAARSDAAEYQVTVVLATQMRLRGDELDDDEERVMRERLQRARSMAGFVGVRLVAPAGDQVIARRLWCPHRCGGVRLVADYRQYLLADAVAGLGPLLQSGIGDPQGAVLGVVDERGSFEPVLFDPALGPKAVTVGGAPRSPAVGIVGRPGSGKSVFTKRCVWTAAAGGGQVVIIDRSETGEYVHFAQALSIASPTLRVELIDVTDPDGPGIDPMRVGLGAKVSADATVRLLSVVAGLDPRGPIAVRLQLTAGRMASSPMADVVAAAAEGAAAEDAATWSALAALVQVLGEDTIGSALFDPRRRAADLSANIVVLWAPLLSLTETPESPADIAASAAVVGMMLVARGLIFKDPGRFAALVMDEAWSQLKDPRALGIVVEALRDGRKHNAAVWLASQSPSDFTGRPEVAELLGYVALFEVGATAVNEACAVAGVDPEVAGDAIRSLDTGTMLWRDVYGRVGLVDVFLPAHPGIAAAADTTPTAADDGESPQGAGVPAPNGAAAAGVAGSL